jgi:hypothetical protein
MKNAPIRNHLGFWALTAATLMAAAGCGGDDHPHTGGATGSVCPSGNTLTYASFGESFMTRFCIRCHSTALMGDMRQGAPADHNFNSFAGVFRFADHIDEHAAAGPNAVNTDMPPSDPRPTEDERRQLGQWLACETSDDDGGGGTGDSGTSDGGTRDAGGTQDTGRGEIVSGDGRSGG